MVGSDICAAVEGWAGEFAGEEGETFVSFFAPAKSLQSEARELQFLKEFLLVLQVVWLDQEDVQLLKEGEEVTLMDWGNAIVQTISKSPDGKTITGKAMFQTLVLHHVLVYCSAWNDLFCL